LDCALHLNNCGDDFIAGVVLSAFCHDPEMREIILLLVRLLFTLARFARPGGLRSVIAESVTIKHQLLILNRSRQRSPNLRVSDRITAGLCVLPIHSGRRIRSAIVLKASTLMRFHLALKDRKYRLLFSPKSRKKPGPKGL
jgi:putative transposase